MPQVNLTELDIKNILAIIDASQISGGSAEAIVELKGKLKSAIPTQPAPVKIEEQLPEGVEKVEG